jgi:hypothetical protein
MEAVPITHRPLASPLRRRRRGDRRAIVASMLAVLGLVACVMAILMLATQPTAARLEGEIGALNRRLGADHTQLAALAAAVTHESTLTADLGRIAGRLHGLERTVHGLQTASVATENQAAGLRACVPELQRELTGLALRTRSVRGQVMSVGLSSPMLLSSSCEALFSGL